MYAWIVPWGLWGLGGLELGLGLGLKEGLGLGLGWEP